MLLIALNIIHATVTGHNCIIEFNKAARNDWGALYGKSSVGQHEDGHQAGRVWDEHHVKLELRLLVGSVILTFCRIISLYGLCVMGKRCVY